MWKQVYTLTIIHQRDVLIRRTKTFNFTFFFSKNYKSLNFNKGTDSYFLKTKICTFNEPTGLLITMGKVHFQRQLYELFNNDSSATSFQWMIALILEVKKILLYPVCKKLIWRALYHQRYLNWMVIFLLYPIVVLVPRKLLWISMKKNGSSGIEQLRCA